MSCRMIADPMTLALYTGHQLWIGPHAAFAYPHLVRRVIPPATPKGTRRVADHEEAGAYRSAIFTAQTLQAVEHRIGAPRHRPVVECQHEVALLICGRRRWGMYFDHRFISPFTNFTWPMIYAGDKN